MFNEKGVDNTSTRHIAAEMQISVGNLHYHYANKKEVLLAIQKQFTAATDCLASQLQSIDVRSFTDFNLIIKNTFGLIYDYRFIFNDRLILSRKYPETDLVFYQMIRTRTSEFHTMVGKLREESLIRADLPDSQYDFLFKQITMLYNSWSSHIKLFSPELSDRKEIIECYSKLIASIWIPYFTEKGIQHFGIMIE